MPGVACNMAAGGCSEEVVRIGVSINLVAQLLLLESCKLDVHGTVHRDISL